MVSKNSMVRKPLNGGVSLIDFDQPAPLSGRWRALSKGTAWARFYSAILLLLLLLLLLQAGHHHLAGVSRKKKDESEGE